MVNIEKIKQTPITCTFLLLSVLVFLVARITEPENVRFLALDYNELPQRWYTVISYGVVHVEWYHILINMVILVFVGSWVEMLLGSKRYIILVVTSILAGGLSLILRETGGIGFSAAGAGILFYYYFAFPWERELPLNLPNIILPLAIMILSVMAIVFEWLPSVGHYPHIAGALTGVILLICFRKRHNLMVFNK